MGRAPAHFHARCGAYEIVVQLATGVAEGQFPKRALRHVLEWYELHRNELEEDWELAAAGWPLRPIDPLE